MLKSTVIYFVGRFGSAVITMVSVAIYTRLMAPDEYGVYALVMSGALVAYAATMQWLALSLGRFLPEYQDQEAVVLSHVAMVYGATTLLVLASAGILVPWLVPTTEMRAVLILGIGVFLATTPAELTLINFQMRGNAYRYVQFTLLRVMVAAAIGVTLAYLGWGSVGVLSGVIAGHLCIVLPNLAGTWGSVRRSLLCKQLFRELAAYGLPFAATGALAAVIHASDRYIIGVLIGTDAAGLYAAPYDLAMRSLYVLMLVVAMAGNPLILRACEEGGEAAARPLIRRQVELLLGLALPAAIAFVLLSPAIVNVFLGEAFQATARELMPWIVAATVLNGFSGLLSGVGILRAQAADSPDLRLHRRRGREHGVELRADPENGPDRSGGGHGPRLRINRDHELPDRAQALPPALATGGISRDPGSLRRVGADPVAGARRHGARPGPAALPSRRSGLPRRLGRSRRRRHAASLRQLHTNSPWHHASRPVRMEALTSWRK
jgi:O-antigen/teichoic acid export membrane protein